MEGPRGRCQCGAVTWRVDGPVRWAAICHCEDCRRAASADYVSWFGALSKTVSWTGPRAFHRSSTYVIRSHCNACGAPMSFHSDRIPDQVCLYAPSLDDPSWYKPAAHLYWPERVPCVQTFDDLPKFDEGLQAAQKRGAPIFAGTGG